MIDQFRLRALQEKDVASYLQSNSAYTTWGKRFFDVSFVILASPSILLTVAILWVLVRLDGGPGFYSQKRVGQGGREFDCWKLRSMVPNSHQVLHDILESDPVLRAEWERDQKLKEDPRITALGRILRKTSLDELPQFWNVLKGDMSIVGPRPVLPEELERYGSNARHYLSIRPGVTGAWQVSGRNELRYEERVAIDVGYAGSFTLFLDTKIVVLTVWELLRLGGR